MKSDVVCVDDNSSRFMDRRKSLEDAGLALMDASAEAQAVNLLVFSESDFDMRAQWLIEETHGFQYPFFQEWFDDWKRRTTESKNSDR